MEASPSRLPLQSQEWKRLLRDPVRAPDSSSCPEEASASKLAQEGFWFLWAVLFVCLALEGYPVLLCVFSPGVLLIPLNYPREIFFLGGRKGSGGRGQAEGTEAKAPKMTCHGLLSSLYRHGRQSSQLRHGHLSPQLRHGHLSPQLQSVCSTLEVPVLSSGPCLS